MTRSAASRPRGAADPGVALMAFRPPLLRVAVALVVWLAALVCGAAAPAQTITNVAAASWTQQGQTLTAQSNAVSFTRIAATASITTYAVGPGAATTLAFTPSQCGGVPIAVSTGPVSTTQIASVTQTTTVQIGSTFYFTVAAPQANIRPGAIDSLQVVLTTSGGDKETITVYETAPNSGLFAGAVPTAAIPPQPVQGDCRLSVAPGDTISLAAVINGQTTPIAIAELSVADDPFGFVFDSESGASVSGASVTLVDAATGQPAKVLGPDGVTAWPATVTTGQPVTDGAGATYQLAPGEYLFPQVSPGQYRLQVSPPAPYTAPSRVSAANLAGIVRPDGTPVVVRAGSFGAVFTVNSPQPLRIDVPVDKPTVAATITKTVNRSTAQPGDLVFYTVTVGNPEPSLKRDVTISDTPARQLRIRPQSVRIDGAPAGAQAQFSRDGRTMTVNLGTMAGGASHVVVYAAVVSPGAAPGLAPNTASVTDSRGSSASSHAVVQILADLLTDRLTLVGRVTDGGCVRAGRKGIPGVRVMLEDGSYAITDKDGRYHFDGLVPGDHVAAVAPSTLPPGGHFVDCARSSRTAASAVSRFVEGQGGSLAVADFYAEIPAGAAPATAPAPNSAADRAASDKAAAGADIDWLAQGDGATAFLFPAPDYNPRSPAVRVAIRHRAGQRVELAANGQPVPKVAFEGVRTSADGSYAVSLWSGLPLDAATTNLTAVVRNKDGSVAARLERAVHFANVAAQVRLVPEKTHLAADGVTRPVIALRILDAQGHPVHRGLAGDLTISAPYESAEVINAVQARSLVGLGRAAPHWTVEDDDGVAYVELAPTMVSGALHLDFTFDANGIRRHQAIDTWVVPGNVPWTLVGLAEGSVGAQTIADRMERTGRFDSDLGRHARTAFYAKGRILGKFLLTLAYDSAKQSADQFLGGGINPNAYYTVFADGANRRYDAASRSPLYVRIEARAFTALFGDFQTALTQTQLARYQRTLTGVSGEATLGHLHLKGFGARTATTHRHLEIQGGGLSGPYALGTTAMVPDSETITIEVRDRFRSQEIVSSTTLTRFVDYTIDVLSGTVSFKSPVLSHDSNGNPQFILIDFDADPVLGAAADALVGGGRVDYAAGRVKLGLTAISDKGSNAANPAARTALGALDAKIDLDAHTQLRAEAAASRALGQTAIAWQGEIERHDARLDMLAYARSADRAFGLGDTGNAELGWRKIGVDAKWHATRSLAFTASVWTDQSLTSVATREAAQVKAQVHHGSTDYHLGLSAIADHLAASAGSSGADSSQANSTVIDAGASRKFLHDKLQIDATASFAVGHANSIDLPANDSVTARYSFSQRVKLIAGYDIAHGSSLATHTARVGFELQPWRGAKAVVQGGDQQVAEYGARSFAEFGLTQSLPVTRHLALDASIDANKVLHGFDAAKILNLAQPVVNGGQLNGSGTLTENFTALTLGAGWKQALWAATLRGEWRDGEFARRRGLTGGLIRQLGDGRTLGAGLTLTSANGSDRSRSAVLDSSIAFADRPAEASYALLGKIEYRADTLLSASAASGVSGSVPGASTIIGLAGTAGDTGLVTGNQNARRLIGSVTLDWSPRAHADDGQFVQRSEASVFVALRYNFARYDGYNLAGTTIMAGLDAHVGLGARFELGGSVSLRANPADGTTSFAIGPSLGFVPAKNMLINVGYNVTGFRDPDFSAARSTRRGVYATLRVKFDTSSFAFLGLDGKVR